MVIDVAQLAVELQVEYAFMSAFSYLDLKLRFFREESTAGFQESSLRSNLIPVHTYQTPCVHYIVHQFQYHSLKLLHTAYECPPSPDPALEAPSSCLSASPPKSLQSG